MTERPRRNGAADIQVQQSPDEEQGRRRRAGLFAWLLMAFLSVCLLFTCGRLAGLQPTGPAAEVDLASKMKADYGPWGYTTFGPISPSILLDILQELKLSTALVPSISGDCLIPGTCRTPTISYPTETATPAPPTATPTVSPTPSSTPTTSATFTPSSTATTVPTATNTPTPTPLVYPVKVANPSRLDPLQEQIVSFSILVINYGSLPPAELTAVCDFLPAGLSYVAGSADRGGAVGPCPDGSGIAIVWNVSDSIPQDGFSRFTFEAQSSYPAAGTTLTNTVRTIGGNFDTATNWKTVQAYTPTPEAVANDDSYTTNEDVPAVQAAPGVLGNDVNADSAAVVATPSNGSVVLNSDGSLTYTPNLNWHSPPVDSFVYQACASGGTCDSASVSINVVSVEDAPIVANDDYGVDEDGFLSVPAGSGVLANDNDPDDGDLLWAINPSTLTPAAAGVVSGFSTNGAFNFTPSSDYFGSATFDYQACDEGAPGPGRDCTTGTVTITVNPVNDLPVAADDPGPTGTPIVTNEDTPVTIDVLANDSDPVEGSAISVNSVSTSAATHGAVTNNGGNVTYDPDANYNGTASFTYDIIDADGGVSAATATVSLTVIPINDPPVAVDDDFTVSQFAASAVLDVLANDADPSDPVPDSLHVEALPAPPTPNATVTINTGGADITYEPDGVYHSPTIPDTFDYTVCDDGQSGSPPAADPLCDTATVSVIVNDAPASTDDSYSTDEDTTLSVDATDDPAPPVGVLANDSDPNGDAITAVLDAGPSDAAAFTLDPDGSFVYTPDPDFNGSDSFTYHATDGALDSTSTTVSITVAAVNDAPIAQADAAITDETTTITIPVLDNDTDVDTSEGDSLAVTDPDYLYSPDNGATITTDGTTIDYTAASSFYGDDHFTYQVCDAGLWSPGVLCDTAEVTVTVNGPPTAVNDSDTTPEDTAVDIDVIANDTDPNDPASALTVYAGSITNVVGGTAVLQPGGQVVRFTPSADANDDNTPGGFGFEYRAYDGRLPSVAAAQVTISVAAQNDPPDAVDDGSAASPVITVNEDPASPASIPVTTLLANDSDPEGDPLSVTSVGNPSSNGGAVALDDNGSPGNPDDDFVTYDPASNFYGTDSFTYTISDGNGGNDTATVTLQVDSVNDPPVANPDSGYLVGQGGTLSVSAANGVLDNDTDVESDPLTAVHDGGPSHSLSFTLNPDGSFDYQPNPSYSGTDVFTYHANDGTDGSNVTTVTILIDDPPVAADDAYSTDEDTELIVDASDDPTLPVGLLDNDSDPNGDTFQVWSWTSPTAEGGSISVASDGSLDYTPPTDFNGDDTFTYRLTDGDLLSAPATVTITVNPVNDPPTAADDGVYNTYDISGVLETDPPDAPFVLPAPGVLANDGDIDGPSPLVAQLVTSPAHYFGFTFNADGSFEFNAEDGYSGADSFTYRACDSALPAACSPPATVSLYVDTLPDANNDGYSVDEGDTLNVADPGVLGNDTDANPGDTLTAVLDSSPSHAASFSLGGDGSFSYTPDADWYGTDSFTYHVNDSLFDSPSTATVTISVLNADDAPVAGDDNYALDEDDSLSVPPAGLLDNDTDPDNLSAPYNAGLSVDPTPVATPSHAQAFTLASDGSFDYTPVANYHGADQFQYRVCDATVPTPLCDVGTVDLAIASVNDPPVAVDDSAAMSEDPGGLQVIDVLDNDTEVDTGDSLSVDSVSYTSGNGATVQNNGSNVSYLPASDWNGTDSFDYTVCDDGVPQYCDAATVTVTVSPENDPPVAADDSASMSQFAGPTVIDVLANDADHPGESDGLSVSSVDYSSGNGATVVNNGSSISYEPDGFADPTVPDTFEYTVCDDGQSGSPPSPDPRCDTATVRVTVNDPPAASADSYSAEEDITLTVDASDDPVAPVGVLSNDSDPNGHPINAVLDGGPSHADSFTLGSDGSFSYTPEGDYFGPDGFTYHASDGALDSPTVSVTIDVGPVNDAPTVADFSAGSVDQGGTIASIDLLGHADDVDDVLVDSDISILADPTNGLLTPNGDGTYAYQHAGGASLTDSFTYQACDDGGACSTAGTVSIDINQPQLMIELSPDSMTTDPGSTASFTASFWNDGPGTAYSVVVTASAGAGCTLQSANPIFSGDLAEAAAAFESVVVTSGGDGTTCTVSAAISSTNGTDQSDSSTLTAESPGGLLSFLGDVFGGGGGGAAPSGTPTPTGTPTLALTVESASPTSEPSATLAAGPSATPSATAVASVAATGTPVPTPTAGPSSPTATAVSTVVPVPTPTTGGGEAATATPASVTYRGSWLAGSGPLQAGPRPDYRDPWDPAGWLRWLLARVIQ